MHKLVPPNLKKREATSNAALSLSVGYTVGYASACSASLCKRRVGLRVDGAVADALAERGAGLSPRASRANVQGAKAVRLCSLILPNT